MEKKGTLASPAIALAIRVFPVPGGPTNRAPLGIFPPNFVYLSGLFRKETISSTSCLASASPATSLKVILMLDSLSNSLACDFPTLKIPLPPPAPLLIFRKKKIQIIQWGKGSLANFPSRRILFHIRG